MRDTSQRVRHTAFSRFSSRRRFLSSAFAFAMLIQPVGAPAGSAIQAVAVRLATPPLATHAVRAPSTALRDGQQTTPREAAPARSSRQAGAAEAPVAAVGPGTTITVSILSTPHATHDSNTNADPSVWAVTAVITNTGATTATAPIIDLDMNPNASWFLVPGESRQRNLPPIPPGGHQVVYWFAHRSDTIFDPHTYTVTVSASNAPTVSQDRNAFENPQGHTVQTRSALSTGNNGIVSTSANVVVGAAFTMSVDYDMGTNPQGVTVQPNGTFTQSGNIVYDPSLYRLLSNEVQFRSITATVGPVFQDRTYFPPGSLPAGTKFVNTTYTFVALRPGNARLCPYTDVLYSSNNKYDNGYCTLGGVVNITGTLTFSFTKSVNATTVLEGELLTYTVRYTNTGIAPISNMYVWDRIPAQAITSSVSPAPDPTPGFNTQDRVVWNIGTVAPGASGELMVTVLVNGRGADLADGTSLVNNAFMGIFFDPIDENPAVTTTVTTTLQAPIIAIGKSDGQTNVIQGQPLTYTLRVTNTGTAVATSLVITDVLPSGVTYAGGAVPPPSGQAGQILTWTLSNLAGGGGVYTITLPVTVNFKLPNGALLTNSVQTQYSNQAGYAFNVLSASDVDTVLSPVLDISKRDFPDPVIAGRNVTYTLLITNTGPATATNVLVTDTLPISTTYVSCSGGTSCGINASNVISWAVSSIAPSATAAVTFTANITTGLASGTTIVNQDYGVVSSQTLFLAGPPETTTVFNAVAIVNGTAFNDLNGNGVLDGGEPGISGVTATLPGALQPVTVTNAAGQYTFTLEVVGAVSVSTALPAGYFRTTPSPVFLNVSLETTTTVNFGYAPVTSTFGVIFGTVFDDGNHNGVQGVGESGLSGVSVGSAGAATTPVTTNAFGQYALTYASSGTYTVTETNPPNYVSTTPDSVAQPVSIGASNRVDFGDFLGVRIQGQVFDDLNVNAVNNAEPGVSGALVAAGGDAMTTGPTGVYTLFVTVQPGEPITLTESDPPGYVSTAANPGSAALVQVDLNTLRLDSPISGTVYANNDFGDVLLSGGVVTITGQVFDDANADGLYNDGGVGLANGRASASTGMFITTTASGNFTLYGPPNTAITVTETNPPGYVSTNAIPGNNAVKFDLDTLRVSPLTTGSTSANNYFGDVLSANAAIVTGTLFNDANLSGVFDLGESVFSGQQVMISGTVSLITTTNTLGMYAFALGAGTFLITTSVPAGYYRTTPEFLVLSTTVGTTYPDRNFGFSNRSDGAVIYGTVFDDFDGDGVQDLGEAGLPGAVLSLITGTTTAMTFTTGISGSYSFIVTQPGVWQVQETNPPGYYSTSSDRINVAVTLGNSYQVNFGDSNRQDVGSVHGLVFDDVNANGTLDANEIGIAGAVITTTSDAGDVISVTTGAGGQYSYGFDFVSSGFHTVHEIDPPGYRSTTPNDVTVFVLFGSAQVVDFGDCLIATCSPVIQGTVFDDDNGDGNQDIAEVGLVGVTVSLFSGPTPIAATTTRSNGNYTFGGLALDTYRVVETDPPLYHSTTPNDVHVSVVASETYIVNFGDSNNAFVSSIFGTAFDDVNANAIFDPGEVGIPNVSVSIDGNVTGFPITLTTNSLGQYTFLLDQISPSPVFTLTETDLPGFVSTTPNVVTVTVALNDDYQVDFGDYAGGVGDPGGIRIEGKVFNDLNSNLIDDGEPGISGVVLAAAFGSTGITGVSGAFALFAPSNTGPITATETNLPGYASTVAIAGPGATVIDVDHLLIGSPISGTVYSGNQFGDNGCSVDAYEALGDNLYTTTAVTLTAGAPQLHNFHSYDDKDWVRVDVRRGGTYTFTTVATGARADTVLTLFAPDGVTVVAQSDDSGAPDYSSQIVWKAPEAGTYFLRVVQFSPTLAGCDTDYSLSMEVAPQYFLFLPFVVRD